MDHDNELDVLATYYFHDEVVLYKAPTWEIEVIDDNLDGAEGIIAADMDGDGDLDVLATAFDGDQVVFYENLIITAVEEQAGTLPTAYSLHQNYPNPFNSETEIRFQIPKASHVSWLNLSDCSGGEIKLFH